MVGRLAFSFCHGPFSGSTFVNISGGGLVFQAEEETPEIRDAVLPSGTVAAEGLVAWFRSESGGAKDGSDGILDCDMGHYINGRK